MRLDRSSRIFQAIRWSLDGRTRGVVRQLQGGLSWQSDVPSINHHPGPKISRDFLNWIGVSLVQTRRRGGGGKGRDKSLKAMQEMSQYLPLLKRQSNYG